MNTIQKSARVAGLLYLIYFVVEISADVLGRSPLIVMGDAATTAGNLAAHEWQFRIGFVGDLLAGVLFFLAAWGLYALLKPVNQHLALLFLLLNLGGVAVRFAIDINYVAALALASGAGSLNVFPTEQRQALAMAFINLQKNGYWASQIFFGLWLFPLGYLVFKSGFLPKVLGVILMVHCITWTTTALLYFLYLPGYTVLTNISFPLGFIAEFALTLWLLIQRAAEQKPEVLKASSATV
ncbi:MAG: DUF4386 domain-containing protein [Caldilinea sp. CFX5]|nr:DUF4386 domain-containing protein [Caldilinea sp. CFX5]